jgi:hypothetical protein
LRDSEGACGIRYRSFFEHAHDHDIALAFAELSKCRQQTRTMGLSVDFAIDRFMLARPRRGTDSNSLFACGHSRLGPPVTSHARPHQHKHPTEEAARSRECVSRLECPYPRVVQEIVRSRAIPREVQRRAEQSRGVGANEASEKLVVTAPEQGEIFCRHAGFK